MYNFIFGSIKGLRYKQIQEREFEQRAEAQPDQVSSNSKRGNMSSQNACHRWRNKLTSERSPALTLPGQKCSQLGINPQPSQFGGLINSIAPIQ